MLILEHKFDVLALIVGKRYNDRSCSIQYIKANVRKKDQLFTSLYTAKYMANMFDFSHFNGFVAVLDSRAETSIL